MTLACRDSSALALLEALFALKNEESASGLAGIDVA
jgi:hypothetical protein